MAERRGTVILCHFRRSVEPSGGRGLPVKTITCLARPEIRFVRDFEDTDCAEREPKTQTHHIRFDA